MNPSGKYTSHDLSDAYDEGYQACMDDVVAPLKAQLYDLEVELRTLMEVQNDRDRSTVLRLQ